MMFCAKKAIRLGVFMLLIGSLLLTGCTGLQKPVTDPVETGMQKEYSFIVKQIHPGKEPSDIHEIDRENVRKTPILLREL